MSVIVIYHRADFDGIFCREIAKRFFGERAQYIGWDYGDPVPSIAPGVKIFMLDISVEQLMDRPGLVWIDHHQSAIEKYGERDGWQLNGVAACRLAWRYFNHPHGIKATSSLHFIHREVTEPLAVQLAGEYDIWDKRDPRAELFQHALKTTEVDFQRLLAGDDHYVEQLLSAGKVLQYARNKENESIIKHQGFTIVFQDLTFLACNAARYNSLLFTAGLRPEHDGCLGFKWDGVKGKWSVSLYGAPGKPDIDFSKIAALFGGGGHKQACGFECAQLPFKLGGQTA